MNLVRIDIIDIELIIDGKPYLNNGRNMTLELIKTIDNANLERLKIKV